VLTSFTSFFHPYKMLFRTRVLQFIEKLIPCHFKFKFLPAQNWIKIFIKQRTQKPFNKFYLHRNDVAGSAATKNIYTHASIYLISFAEIV